MLDSYPAPPSKPGLAWIRLAWLFFGASLILPAGKFVLFDLIAGFNHGSYQPKEYNGWQFLLLSSGAILAPIALIAASPFLVLMAMINDLGPVGGLLFISLTLLIIVAIYYRKSSQVSNAWARLFKNIVLIVLGLLVLVAVTSGKDLVSNFHAIPGSSTILIIMTLVFFYSIFMSLGTYESRLYLCTSLIMLSTPGLILCLGTKEIFGILVALPFIALGTISLIQSRPFAKAKRLSEYQNWVLGNLAIANFYIPLGIQQLPPALVTWLLCVGCLAIGNNKRLNSFEEEILDESTPANSPREN